MNIEIREDSTYQFSFYKKVNNVDVPLSTAYLNIYDTGGNAVVEDEAMTIGAGGGASLDYDFSDNTDFTWVRDRNYRAEIVATDGNGETVYDVRFFDIVRYPFVNTVIDDDLINESDYFRDGVKDERGTATSGGTTNLFDSNNRGGDADNYWQGGKIKILPLIDTDDITEHKVVASTYATGEIEFYPARSSAITTEQYIIRRSYQNKIDLAGDEVRLEILAQGHRAYLLMDSSQIEPLIIYRVMTKFFQGLRRAENDEYDLQYKYYKDRYDKLFQSIPLMLDVNDDGQIDSEEENGLAFSSVGLTR